MALEAFFNTNQLRAKVFAEVTRQGGTQADWSALLRKIEQEGWLARQAEILGGFEAPSQELEETVLPYLIEQGDWDRFVRHAATAAQLRGMAQALEEGPVLRSLAEANRLELASNLAARLPDPLQRARAHAQIAATLPREVPGFDLVSNPIQQDLASAELSDSAQDAKRLADIARLVAPRMPQALQDCAGRFARRAPKNADIVWRALAKSWLAEGVFDSAELWEAIRSIRDQENLLDLQPSTPALCEPFLRKIAQEVGEASREARWRLGLPAVEALMCGEGEGDAWTTACELFGPYPASLSWVERAWKLWPELSDEQVRNYLAGAEESVARAAVKVARLGPGSSTATVEAVREEIESLPPGGEQLHLGLRFLEQRPREPTREYEGQLAAMAHHLVHIRYEAPNDDLRRFLDLVARAHETKTLRRQVENVLWAPESSAETLRHLAEHAESEALLEELFEKTEEYAAMAAETSAEGFELRRQTLVTLAARLSARSKDRTFFDKARERLLPEEADDLAESTAEALAEVGCAQVGGEIAREISSGPRRLRTLLEVRPPDLDWDELLSPAGLYEAVADPGPVTDELHSLSALLEMPETPESVETIAHERLDEVNDPGRRIEALIDLAHHSMDYQEDNTPKRLRDFPAAILPLKQALGVVPSNDWLLGITPELVEVGARLGPAQAVAEVQEAWDRLVELEEATEEQREEALVSLLDRIPKLFPEDGQSRRVHRLLDWIESRLEDLETGKDRLAAKLQAVQAGEGPDPEPWDEIAWIESLGKDIGESTLDASDPRTIPLRRRLWQVDRSRALPILAEATIHALGTGGMEGGENALRWFVNVYLAPQMGQIPTQEQEARRDRFKRALESSKRIGRLEREASREIDVSDVPEPEDDDDDESPPFVVSHIFRRSLRALHGLKETRLFRIPDKMALVFPILAVVPLGTLDDTLWSFTTSSQQTPWELWLALFLAGGLVTWSLDRVLRDMTSSSRELRPEARAFRLVLGALPGLSLALLPAWKELASRYDDLLFRSFQSPTSSMLKVPFWKQPVPVSLDRFLGSDGLLIGAGMFQLILIIPLCMAGPGNLLGLLALAFLSLSLHLAGFGLLVLGLLRAQHLTTLSRQRFRVLLLLAGLFLVPVPALPILGMFAVFVGLNFHPETSRRMNALLFHLHRDVYRRGLRKAVSWRFLEARLHDEARSRPSRRWVSGAQHSVRRRGRGQMEKRRIWLRRWKLAALFFEIAFLGVLIQAAAASGGSLEKLWLGLGVLTFWIGLGLFLCDVVLIVTVRGTRWRRRWLADDRVFRFTAGVLLAVGLAIPFGHALARGDAERLAQLWLATGGVTIFLFVATFVVAAVFAADPQHSESGDVEWRLLILLGFGGFALPGALLLQGAPRLDLKVVAALVAAMPVLDVLTSGWLLSVPARSRHVERVFFRGSEKPRGARLQLLIVSALAPWGGLAVSVWLQMRARSSS